MLYKLIISLLFLLIINISHAYSAENNNTVYTLNHTLLGTKCNNTKKSLEDLKKEWDCEIKETPTKTSWIMECNKSEGNPIKSGIIVTTDEEECLLFVKLAHENKWFEKK